MDNNITREEFESLKREVKELNSLALSTNHLLNNEIKWNNKWGYRINEEFEKITGKKITIND
jgi:hypothetical protein